MYKSVVTRNISSNKSLEMNMPRVDDYGLQPGGALARPLNNAKQHWTNPVTGSVVASQLCRWSSGQNIIAQVQVFFLCNVEERLIFHQVNAFITESMVLICRNSCLTSAFV